MLYCFAIGAIFIDLSDDDAVVFMKLQLQSSLGSAPLL
jgi:hypothetical protein